jgi:hypothetical protein
MGLCVNLYEYRPTEPGGWDDRSCALDEVARALRSGRLECEGDREALASRVERLPQRKSVYCSNITHNLNAMAGEAGICKHLWRPGEIGITKAHQLIEPLTAGLALLEARPDHFRQFDSPNGWGLYVHFVPFVESYLAACAEHPDADVSVSR